MARQIRLFIGIPIARKLLETGSEPSRGTASNSVSTVLSQLRSYGWPVKTVAIDALHVTLKFIGEVEAERVPNITQVIEDVAATEFPFELQLEGLGAFPNRERPSVIWVGLRDAGSCSRMATALESQLVECGIPAEERAFRPHLTLARIKGRPPGQLFDLLASERVTSFGAGIVQSLDLIHSELKPDEPRYTSLVSARLSDPSH